jgi:hypothetical protein
MNTLYKIVCTGKPKGFQPLNIQGIPSLKEAQQKLIEIGTVYCQVYKSNPNDLSYWIDFIDKAKMDAIKESNPGLDHYWYTGPGFYEHDINGARKIWSPGNSRLVCSRFEVSIQTQDSLCKASKNERIVFLVDSLEKRKIQEKASALDVSIGKLVRDAVIEKLEGSIS